MESVLPSAESKRKPQRMSNSGQCCPGWYVFFIRESVMMFAECHCKSVGSVTFNLFPSDVSDRSLSAYWQGVVLAAIVDEFFQLLTPRSLSMAFSEVNPAGATCRHEDGEYVESVKSESPEWQIS